MSPPSTLPSVIWLLFYSWAACIAVYGVGIVMAATLAEHLSTTAAACAAYAPVATELVCTGAAIAWVYARSRGVRPGARYALVAAFSLLQLGTCSIALITTLLALNR